MQDVKVTECSELLKRYVDNQVVIIVNDLRFSRDFSRHFVRTSLQKDHLDVLLFDTPLNEGIALFIDCDSATSFYISVSSVDLEFNKYLDHDGAISEYFRVLDHL